MSTAKALVVRFLGSLTVHRKSASWELVCHLNTSFPFRPSWVCARDFEISPFDQENRRLLSKLYSSKNLKVFRKVEIGLDLHL